MNGTTAAVLGAVVIAGAAVAVVWMMRNNPGGGSAAMTLAPAPAVARETPATLASVNVAQTVSSIATSVQRAAPMVESLVANGTKLFGSVSSILAGLKL